EDNVSQFLSRLSPDEGLSQSSVTKTVQDAQGFIWIATAMGLNRYDGYQVSHISGPNDIFDAEFISTLFIDRQGYLWVSTLYSGLYRINTATLATEQYFNGKLGTDDDFISEVITIEQGELNTLWLGISGHVYLLDVDSGQLTKYMSLIGQDHIVRDLLLEQQWLYCATSQGLFRINIQTQHHELIKHLPASIDSQDSINAKFLINDPLLGLLIGTVEGLFQLNQSGVSGPKQLIADLNIWDMVLLDHQYMVATDKGVYLFDPRTLKLSFLTKFSHSSYRITDDNVIDLYKDNYGVMWLASKSQGVLRWSPQTRRFKHVSASTQAKLSHDNVLVLLTDDHDTLWVGTNNGLNKVDLKRNTVVHYLTNDDKKAVSGKQVISGLFEYPGDSNKLWLVNDDGLAIFDKTTGKLNQPFYTAAAKKHLTEPWLGGYHVLDNEHIVFVTLKSHYLYNSISGEITPLAGLNDVANPELSLNFIGSFPQQKNTVLLVSSGHLYRYDLIKKHTTLLYQVKNYQPQTYDSVDNWVIDHNNILWLAVSGEGLIGLDYQTMQEKYRYDTTNKLSTNSIYSLQLDQFNNLWFSSQ
ncbi:MAG: hypothetical protein HRU22_18765, partial [Gammaproteobacteria bacterium]|nr:hypothetical protein [Gammaproteobacteria bacterium]